MLPYLPNLMSLANALFHPADGAGKQAWVLNAITGAPAVRDSGNLLTDPDFIPAVIGVINGFVPLLKVIERHQNALPPVQPLGLLTAVVGGTPPATVSNPLVSNPFDIHAGGVGLGART